MMLERFVFVHLPEDCGRVINLSTFHPTKKRGSLSVTALENASSVPGRRNRNRRIFCRSKPARAGTKVACGEFVADLRRSRPYGFKAVVTHLKNSLVGSPFRL